jgi:hypothetical protein
MTTTTTTAAADDLTVRYAGEIAASALPAGETITPSGMVLDEYQEPGLIATTAIAHGYGYPSASFRISTSAAHDGGRLHASASVHRAETLTTVDAQHFEGRTSWVTLRQDASGNGNDLALYTSDPRALAAILTRAAAALLDLDA